MAIVKKKKSIKFEYSHAKKSRKYQANIHGRDNDTFLIRKSAPGPTAKNIKVFSEYKKQLMTKQKVRTYYAISEKSFSNCIKLALKQIGNTGDLIVAGLESRLMTFVYKAGFASSIYAARQLIAHKHIKVNGKICNIKSRVLKEGDYITLSDDSVFKLPIQERLKTFKAPSYIVVDSEKVFAKLSKKPTLTEIKYPFEFFMNKIIEYYSK